MLCSYYTEEACLQEDKTNSQGVVTNDYKTGDWYIQTLNGEKTNVRNKTQKLMLEMANDNV